MRTKNLVYYLLLVFAAFSFSCDDEQKGTTNFSYESTVSSSLGTETRENEPLPLTLNILKKDPSSMMDLATLISIDGGKGVIILKDTEKELTSGDSFKHNGDISFHYTPKSVGLHTLNFITDNGYLKIKTSITINVKDVHYIVSIADMPNRFLVGKKQSFALNIQERESSDLRETKATAEVIKGSGLVYVADQIINPSEGTPTKDAAFTIGQNLVAYHPVTFDENIIQFKIQTPNGKVQNYNLPISVIKPEYSFETIIDLNNPVRVGKDFSFKIAIKEIDEHGANEFNTSFRFVKGNGSVKLHGQEISSGERKDIHLGENIINIVPVELGETSIEFICNDKWGTTRKDTATFNVVDEASFTISTTASAGGSVTGGGTFKDKSNATLTATPNTGNKFVGFFENGTLVSTNTEYTFQVVSDRTIHAEFTKLSFLIEAIPSEGGSISGSKEYLFGESATLKATPFDGWAYVGLFENGEKVTDSNPHVFQVTKSQSFLAKFEQTPLSVSVDKSSINTKTGTPAAFKLTISKSNYTGTFSAKYIPVSANGNLSGGVEQTLSTGTHNMSFTPSTPGTHTFKIEVKDTKGLKGEVAITVIATNEPLIANINNSNFDMIANEESNLLLTVSEANYTGTFTLQFVQESGSGIFKANDIELGNNSTTQISTGTTKLKYIPSSVDNHRLRLLVSDTRGQEQVVSATINAKARITATATEGGSTTGSGVYSKDENVTVTGVAKEGFKFKHWEENEIVVSSSASYSFKSTAHRSLKAVFEYNKLDVNITAVGNGSVTGSGTYNYNTELTITATALTGSKFVGWFEGDNLISNSSTYSFKVVRNINLQARFIKNTYTITARNGEGGNVTGGGQYEYGTIATLTATPNTGYNVLGWYEGSNMVSNEAKYSFEVLNNRSLEAKFAKNRYTVTVNASEGGSTTGAGTYEYGSTATLTAIPNSEYHFIGWSDGDKTSPRTITINNNISLEAKFAKNRYTVTVNASEGGSTTGAGTYEYGSTATLTATPNGDHIFSGWYVNNELVSNQNPYSLKIATNTILEAKFSPKQHRINTMVARMLFGYYDDPKATGSGDYNVGDIVTLTAPSSAKQAILGGFTPVKFAGWFILPEQYSFDDEGILKYVLDLSESNKKLTPISKDNIYSFKMANKSLNIFAHYTSSGEI